MKNLFVTVAFSALFAIIGTASNLIFSGQTAHAASQSCADGTDRMVFDGSVSGRDTLTVWTKNDKPLCNDVNMNFTTFKLLNPAYNGKGFHNNPTAVPQQSVYNQSYTLKKGTNGRMTVKVQVPDACSNYQIDAYIGPAQTKITSYKEGLEGTAAITGKIFSKTKSDCTVKVCNPATGEIITVNESEASKYKPVDDAACVKTPETPVTPVTPVTPETPAVLPSTGPAEALSALIGTGSLAGAATAYIRSRRALNK